MRRAVVLLGILALVVFTAQAAKVTRLTVEVKNTAGKGVDNASVIVKWVRGFDVTKLKGIQHEWELKTNQEGVVKIPSLPQGRILIQVISKGHQTFGQTYDVDEAEKTIEIRLNPPQPQYSAH